MPPAKRLTARVGAGVLRSVRAAARRRNESVDRFVRLTLWHWCMGWSDDRRAVIEEARSKVALLAAQFRSRAADPVMDLDQRGLFLSIATALDQAVCQIHGLPSRSKRR